jgi:hypothetical protein
MFGSMYKIRFKLSVLENEGLRRIFGYKEEEVKGRRKLHNGGDFIIYKPTSRTALGPTQPPIQWVRGSFRGVKRPGREADHSFPSSSEAKNAWSSTSTSQYVFMAWCLVKKRDKFTFTYHHHHHHHEPG